jgi:hypothetical protein
MRIEIILVLITGFIVFNIYTDGIYLKRAIASKKYLQIGCVIIGSFFVYYLIKKNPMRTKDIIMTSNEYIKYLPVDKNTSDMISPILDFTAKSTYYDAKPEANERIISSGKVPISKKRSVSETKKKFVASRQNWQCGICERQLTAWFEVDHKIRLDKGGSNHIDNLIALCRECHGEKTTIENL